MGHVDKRQEAQRALHDVLLELSSKQNILLPEDDNIEACKGKVREYLERLRVIYDGDDKQFRHQYSPLHALITRMAKEDDKDIEIFQTNLEVILTALDDSETEDNSVSGDLFDKCFKLYDHLALEIARWQTASSLEWQVFGIEKKISDVRKQLDEDEKLSSEISEKIKDSEQRFSKIQSDFVAILAIFAAVVIAFSSGSGYVLSSIAAVGNAPLDRLVSVVLVCGLVLMDTLFMLMYFIGRIIDRGLGVKWWIVLMFNAFVIVLILLARCTPFFSPESIYWWIPWKNS